MKVDRLLEIIIYLLNHETASASHLAERFHVSVRTIQRDMVSISEAGIPVYAVSGKYGGYSILPDYKLKNCGISKDEQQMIKKALESLATSYVNETLCTLVEKYNALVEKEGGQSVYWDFGVSRENRQVQSANVLLENAIEDKLFITFSYRNASGGQSVQHVQPLALQYKWYAWYLFAYSVPKEAYRTFKVARMTDLKPTGRKSDIEHPDISQMMEKADQEYAQTSVPIEVHFLKEDRGLIEEYFPDSQIEAVSGEECRVWIVVPVRERLWKALLLSFGDKVWIVSPEAYKHELVETAQRFAAAQKRDEQMKEGKKVSSDY